MNIKRRLRVRSYMFISVFLMVVLNMPDSFTQAMRSLSIGAITTPWNWVHQARGKMASAAIEKREEDSFPIEEAQRLEEENVLLRSQMQSMRHWLLSEGYLEKHLRYLLSLRNAEAQGDRENLRGFLKMRTQQLAHRLEQEMQVIPARVIYREPTSWNSVLWIDIGEEANRLYGRTVIGKHSPVIVGGSLVGIVENVRKHSASVRLITESRLAISVQAVRGGEQDRYVLENIEALSTALRERENVFEDPRVQDIFFATLQELKIQFQNITEENLVARGEIFGSSQPLWRKRGNLLKGIGFSHSSQENNGARRPPLICGDLLISAGLDGVFPPGFKVGTVIHVAELKEGDVAYEIEAKAMIENWENLSEVSILPPLNFN